MSTVSKSIAEKCANNNGRYPGDPQSFAVIKYLNCIFGHECYAICDSRAKYNAYVMAGHQVLDILWTKDENLRLLASIGA